MYLIKPPVMSAAEESSRSNSNQKKNISAYYSNYDVRLLNTFPEHVHLHEEDAVEWYVDREEGSDNLSSDPVQRHIEFTGTFHDGPKRWI